VIKSVALLADLGETLGLLLPEPIELSVELDKEGLHQPTSGMKCKMLTIACETVTWKFPWSILVQSRLLPLVWVVRNGAVSLAQKFHGQLNQDCDQ
jgi:hypothetical protein